MARRLLVVALVALACAPPAAAATRTFTYTVEERGAVAADVATFRQVVASTLTDDRGWSLDGAIAFRRVAAGGDLHVLLADPSRVANAAPVCSRQWSCRVGDMVLINERRWRRASPAWPLSLHEYRHYVVNHEVGHWLGLAHRSCPGPGRTAPVMQQQSISLDGCDANVWPLASERERVARTYGVTVGGGEPWPVPIPGWFWEWARWYLHRAEFADEPFRSAATRPDAAPLRIPDWAWRRLEVLVGGETEAGKPWPVPIPGWFWSWARWYLGRGEFADEPLRSDATRPESAPYPIPSWAWRRLEALLGQR